jgi:hypothetical protein
MINDMNNFIIVNNLKAEGSKMMGSNDHDVNEILI